MTMSKKILAAFPKILFMGLSTLLLLCYIGSATASTQGEWVRTYEEFSAFYSENFVQANDGGFIIAGRTDSEVLLLKTDSEGNLEWNQTYSKGVESYANSLIKTNDGGYALITRNSELIKLNSSGYVDWKREFPNKNWIRTLIQTKDSGYVLAGSSGNETQSEESYFWVLKTDQDGQAIWNKTYPTIVNGSVASVIQTFDGGFALLGSDNFNPDFVLVKIDKVGQLDWSKKYGSNDWDTGQSIIQNDDGGYTLAGTLWNRSDNNNMAGLIKIDSKGDLLWQKNYPGRWVVSMVQTQDDNYVICSDLNLTKIDSNGKTQWSQNLNFVYDNLTRLSSKDLIPTFDGGYAILGKSFFLNSNGEPTGVSYVWIMKTNEKGVVPEFPSLIVLPLFFILTFIAYVFKDRLAKPYNYLQHG